MLVGQTIIILKKSMYNMFCIHSVMHGNGTATHGNLLETPVHCQCMEQ